MAKGHEGLRDEHANLHANHTALADLHEQAGHKDLAHIHQKIAGHHLQMAEHHHEMTGAETSGAAAGAEFKSMAAEAPPAQNNAPAAKPAARGDALAIGAANQLHRKGHIDRKTRDRIHRSARRPFGSMAPTQSGHYDGDVDTANSGGTNSV